MQGSIAHLVLAFTLLCGTAICLPRRSASTCSMPLDTERYALIVKHNAEIAAHEAYRALHVGGDLLSSDDSVTKNIASHNLASSYVSGTHGVGFNFKGGLRSGPDVSFEDFEDLARRVLDSGSSSHGSDLVVTVDQGGTYQETQGCHATVDTSTFRGVNGVSEDDGKTMVVFKGEGTVCLSKTSSAVQFGPTVLAPFAHVVILDDVGYVDGTVIAKSVSSPDTNSAVVNSNNQLHGDIYSGTILCITGSPTVEPTQAPSTGSPTVEPTQAPSTDSPTVEPTQAPSTDSPTVEPTQAPSTGSPTVEPTQAPSTDSPTVEPTQAPSTDSPTTAATSVPTPAPAPGTTGGACAIEPSQLAAAYGPVVFANSLYDNKEYSYFMKIGSRGFLEQQSLSGDDRGRRYFMGSYAGVADVPNQVVIEYKDGSNFRCPDSKKRLATVALVCGGSEQGEIISVVEPAVCEYEVTFAVSACCASPVPSPPPTILAQPEECTLTDDETCTPFYQDIANAPAAERTDILSENCEEIQAMGVHCPVTCNIDCYKDQISVTSPITFSSEPTTDQQTAIIDACIQEHTSIFSHLAFGWECSMILSGSERRSSYTFSLKATGYSSSVDNFIFVATNPLTKDSLQSHLQISFQHHGIAGAQVGISSAAIQSLNTQTNSTQSDSGVWEHSSFRLSIALTGILIVVIMGALVYRYISSTAAAKAILFGNVDVECARSSTETWKMDQEMKCLEQAGVEEKMYSPQNSPQYHMPKSKMWFQGPL